MKPRYTLTLNVSEQEHEEIREIQSTGHKIIEILRAGIETLKHGRKRDPHDIEIEI